MDLERRSGLAEPALWFAGADPQRGGEDLRAVEMVVGHDIVGHRTRTWTSSTVMRRSRTATEYVFGGSSSSGIAR